MNGVHLVKGVKTLLGNLKEADSRGQGPGEGSPSRSEKDLPRLNLDQTMSRVSLAPSNTQSGADNGPTKGSDDSSSLALPRRRLLPKAKYPGRPPHDPGLQGEDHRGQRLPRLDVRRDSQPAISGSDNSAEREAGQVKTKGRGEYGHRFSIYSTFTKMRGTKKEKPTAPDQTEPPAQGSQSPPSHSPDLSQQDFPEDAGLLESLRAEHALLQQKVLRLAEQLRVKQSARSANVSEYLRLVSEADQAQAVQLQQAFEEKNRHLSSRVEQLQGRLEQYVKRQGDLDSDISLLLSKDHLPVPPHLHSLRSASLQDPSPLSSDPSSTRLNLLQFPLDPQPALPSDDRLSVTTAEAAGAGGFELAKSDDLGFYSLLQELTEVKETLLNMELHFKSVAEQYRRDHTALEQLLHEERYRSKQLQAQFNDLMELHQNEVVNLKSELASLEEKIAYQSYESSRDIWEVLESFQTKMTRLEQLQQVSQVEGLDSRNTRQLLGKSVNLLLIIFAVVLMLMSTLSALILPFIRTRARTVTTCTVLLLLVFVWHNWDTFSSLPARRSVHQ